MGYTHFIMLQFSIALLACFTIAAATSCAWVFMRLNSRAGDALTYLFSGIAASQALVAYVLLTEPVRLIWLYGGSVGLLFLGTAICWGIVAARQISTNGEF